jgi:hypothetical protein
MNSHYIPNDKTRQVILAAEITDVNNKVVSFPRNDEIEKRTSRIVSIESFSATQVPYTDKDKSVVAATVHNKSYLTIKDAEGNTLRKMPLKSLLQDAEKTEIPLLNLKNFSLQSSEVEIGNLNGVALNTHFLFLVTYEKA